jgi:transcriptional regulator NrdR family protein
MKILNKKGEFTKGATDGYLKNSARCPFCGAEDTVESAGKEMSDSDYISRLVHCTKLTCRQSWWEIYTLSAIDTVRHP